MLHSVLYMEWIEEKLLYSWNVSYPRSPPSVLGVAIELPRAPAWQQDVERVA
jgi:hypothetical protein